MGRVGASKGKGETVYYILISKIAFKNDGNTQCISSDKEIVKDFCLCLQLHTCGSMKRDSSNF